MYVLLSAALLPAALLFLYILRQDPQPEPPKELIKAVLAGIGICIPVIFVEGAVEALLFGGEVQAGTLLDAGAQAFLVAALPEEGFKLLALWWVLRRNPYFDEHFDGIVYAVCVGLGFAAVENVMYVFQNVDAWQSVALSRALLAVPGHYAFAVLMGYYYSIYHFVSRTPRTAACVLLAPVLAHGIYDTLAFSGQIDAYIGSIGFVVLIYFCIKLQKIAQRKVAAQIQRDRNEQPFDQA